MDLSFSGNIQQNKDLQASSMNKATELSANFQNTLNNVVSRNMNLAVQPNEHLETAAFRKKKEQIEKAENIEQPENQEEPIHKTVKELEKKLIALARLERKTLAGF